MEFGGLESRVAAVVIVLGQQHQQQDLDVNSSPLQGAFYSVAPQTNNIDPRIIHKPSFPQSPQVHEFAPPLAPKPFFLPHLSPTSSDLASSRNISPSSREDFADGQVHHGFHLTRVPRQPHSRQPPFCPKTTSSGHHFMGGAKD